MIVDAIISAALDTVTWLVGLMPEDGIDWPSGAALQAMVAEYGGPFNSMIPLEETAEILVLTVTLVAPITISLKVTQWLWFLLPVVK